ncbi:MAG: RNA polymerase sigma factor [Rhodospirillales bacterium]|nr:RNA polymerase sigma factor [Rhodospirillales bacterium]MCB9996402.1 RNA polymerase sigma factor [Rhodospirillales bacterium]
MSNEEDQQLIERALAGDRDAFNVLIGKYYDMMYRLAFKWCGNRADAEDIAHNAFLKVADHLPGFKHDSSFKTWLYRIVINVANDAHRKKKVRRAVSGGLEELESPARTDHALQAQEIAAMVGRLPQGEREAIMLVSGQGLSHAEAAEILGCKESTISWRIHEARKKLGAMLGKDDANG